MNASRGRFIVLEGGEGAGKSTQARHVRDWLVRQGREAVLTREPGGTALAEAIRGVLLREADPMPPLTELLLMFAARHAHVTELIRPALSRGADVVCDRFVDASYAYQGAGRGLPLATLQTLENLVLEDLRPDLVLVFDIDPALGLQRTRTRGETNRFENETLAFQQRVRAAYLARAQADPDRYVVLDAAAGIEHVRMRVAQILEARL